MIPRIEIEVTEPGSYEYAVSHEREPMFSDAGFASVLDCLVAAIEGLPPEVRAVEVACGGIVSGTYPLESIAMNPQPVADHAVHTTAAVLEALNE